jgi:hypothetical protein
MKTNLITIGLVLVSLSIISCRQSEEMFIDQEEQISAFDNNASRLDSTVTFDNNEPPKTGTHWKVMGDSIKTPPKFENFKNDSLSYSSNIDENEPPKTGTHWKVK